MQSAGQAAVAQQIEQVEVGGLRHRALVTVQKFKSSWVELGALLVEVRRSGGFEAWGFKSFEEYCSKELRLKRQTAEKLTSSYSFLVRHEKQALDARVARIEEAPPVPPFEVLSVLAGAEDRGQLDGDGYQELRQSLWEDDRPPTKVAREMAQRFPAPKPTPRAQGGEDGAPVDLQLKRLAASARKLHRELSASGRVPKAVVERAEALADDVEELAR